jgi:hypothetical protein
MPRCVPVSGRTRISSISFSVGMFFGSSRRSPGHVRCAAGFIINTPRRARKSKNLLAVRRCFSTDD